MLQIFTKKNIIAKCSSKLRGNYFFLGGEDPTKIESRTTRIEFFGEYSENTTPLVRPGSSFSNTGVFWVAFRVRRRTRTLDEYSTSLCEKTSMNLQGSIGTYGGGQLANSNGLGLDTATFLKNLKIIQSVWNCMTSNGPCVASQIRKIKS